MIWERKWYDSITRSAQSVARKQDGETMRSAIKNVNAKVIAFQLGQGSEMEKALLKAGRVIQFSNGIYEVFSQEATGTHGEKAYAGDYVKIDSAGFPYPNRREFFEENHRRVGENEYEQIAKPLSAWCFGDPDNEIICFLVRKKDLVVDTNNPEQCFSAPLWGTMLTARRDAVIVFYKVDRDESGNIIDVDFNFVARDEFDKTYSFIDLR